MSRNSFMLRGISKKNGYDWWWHNFVAVNKKTGELKPFFVEYYVINPYKENKKPILGQLKSNKENNVKPSYAMVKAGTWGKDAVQINNFYGIADFKASSKEMDVKIGNNVAKENEVKGRVNITEEEEKLHPEFMCNSGTMEWNLKLNKVLSYSVGYGASPFFRFLNAFQMYWHVQGMKVQYEGNVLFNNEEYEVLPDKSYGYQDKNWGSDYTNPWVWLNCNNLTSKLTGRSLKNTSFDVGGGRPVVLGRALYKKLLIAFYYEGKLYEFNFSKFWKKSNQKYDCKIDDEYVYWDIEAEDRKNKIEINFKCPKDTMLLINYENPKGEKKHNKLFNGGYAFGVLKFYEQENDEWKIIDELLGDFGGCEYGEY